MFNQFPGADGHTDCVFRGYAELEVVKGSNIFQEAGLLWQDLTDMSSLPPYEREIVSKSYQSEAW